MECFDVYIRKIHWKNFNGAFHEYNEKKVERWVFVESSFKIKRSLVLF